MIQIKEVRLQRDVDSDDDLLLAIGQGDQYAFRLLMERHSRTMLALAQRLTGNPQDADEIVQEAFLKVWRLAAKWDPNGTASFATWFYRIVFNACLDRRRRAPMAPLEDAGDPVDPGPIGWDRVAARQRRETILSALEDLPKRQKEAVWLYYFGDVSGAEAARILEMSQSAVEALLVRGRRALKNALAKRGITSGGDLL